MDLLEKLKQAAQVASDSKTKLEGIEVEGIAGTNDVRILISAAKTPLNVFLSDELVQRCDKEEIEDLILVALRNALAKADAVADEEMRGSMGSLLGGFPGL